MLLSIHLTSNRPENFANLIKNIEESATNPTTVEVIVNIDNGHTDFLNLLQSLQKTSAVTIKFLETDIIKSFKDVAKSYNPLLQLTDPNVEFVTLFSDEFRFKTKGWDDVIRKYIHYYEDDIFRIRLSRYRYRNYRDFWECVFAPDSLAFYTKKWMDIVGQWCPCTGPDSWQELVSFYLINARRFDHIQYNRNVVEPFLEFEGEGASAGLIGAKMLQRNKDNFELWFETVSHEMQEKASEAAAMLQKEIILSPHNSNSITHNFIANLKPHVFDRIDLSQVRFVHVKHHKKIAFFCQDRQVLTIHYRLNKIKFFIINNFRKLNYPYYAGGGVESIRTGFFDQVYNYYRIKKYGKFNYLPFFKKRFLNFSKI